METKYGFPVVNSENIFSVLEKSGIKRWPKIRGPIPLNIYKHWNLNEQRKKEIRLFAPRVEVEIFRDPTGNSFTGFRSAWLYGAGTHVFTVLPGNLIPIAAEFRHGADVVSLILPGGVFDGKDANLEACAKREFEEETGILLKAVIPLETMDTTGIPVSARQTNQRCHGFLGILPEELIITEQRLEPKEFLKIVLIPLTDWINLIMEGKVKEGSAIISTFQALYRLNKIIVQEGGSECR